MEGKRIPRTKTGWPTLSRLMDAKGITEELLAELLAVLDVEVSARTILAYRRGEIKPPVETVVAMAKVLRVSEEVLRKDGPIPPVFTPQKFIDNELVH